MCTASRGKGLPNFSQMLKGVWDSESIGESPLFFLVRKTVSHLKTRTIYFKIYSFLGNLKFYSFISKSEIFSSCL